MNREFWKDRKILITGHTGFKGSWLSLWLQAMGAKVVGYSLPPPTRPSLFELARVSQGMTSVVGDVRDFDSLKSTIAQQEPEIIFHMAAQSVVSDSYENPVETYSTNVMGTVNLLEAVRQLRRPRVVVNVTSDKCYENREWVWGYRENDAMGGHDPYSNSKGCSELVTASFRSSFFGSEDFNQHGVAVASVRAGNVIGGGDWTRDQLIPDIMRAFTESRPVLIRRPDAIRPWQFVLEALNGYLTVAERLLTHGSLHAEAWNFGPEDDDAKSVGWVAENIRRLWGDGARWEIDTARYPHEAHSLKLDISKSKRILGWTPRMRLDCALEWVVEWYRSYERKEDVRQTTLSQISRYEKFGAE